MLEIEFVAGKIIVDGIVDEHSYYINNGKKGRTASFYKNEVISILNNYSPLDIRKYFDVVQTHYYVDFWAFPIDIDISVATNDLFTNETISLKFTVDTDLWAVGWSLKDFANELRDAALNSTHKDIVWYFQQEADWVTSGFGLIFKVSNPNEKISGLLSQCFEIAKEIVATANQRLIAEVNSETVISFFNFPETVKVPCQQYLMYFAQFLKDLGINAKTEIKEQAHTTLFEITPINKEEALDKIREALDIYINAPALDELQFQNNKNNDIAFIQLQANVMHLKSQMMLANSVVQMKDATIEALQLSNYQLKDMVEVQQGKINQEEDIIPGIVAVSKYDGNGFSLNFAEILKRLKRNF